MIQRRNLLIDTGEDKKSYSILKIDLLDFFVIHNTLEEVRSKGLINYTQQGK